jgi:benzoyl-CoA reductase/2-hydroxyglutaryl-CoA dehydratase subunit BcrC/BadD/HgdB
MLLIDTINSLSLTEKRNLVKSLKQIIAEEVKDNKISKIIAKSNKEAEKKAKIELQIKAAQDKLAKLTAKLSA